MITKIISTPSPAQVNKYIKKWKRLDNYVLQESSLRKLFIKTYPQNADIDDILIKVCSLNDFYSTNIYSPVTVARHIQRLKIDESLSRNDLVVVDKISKVKMRGGRHINFYSFASKYCSHHKPEVYPIYDSYVEKVLIHFRKTDKFYNFRNTDLKKYSKFNEILSAFRDFYGLDSYTIKDIDKYLWQLGKEYFPRKY